MVSWLAAVPFFPLFAFYSHVTVVGYIHYLANGSIVPATIDANGVGTYDVCVYRSQSNTASDIEDGRIEAENFFKLIGAGHKQDVDVGSSGAAGQFVVAGLERTSELHYPHVRNLDISNGTSSSLSIVLYATNSGARPGIVHVTLKTNMEDENNSQTVALATCEILPSGSELSDAPCHIEVVKGVSGGSDLDVIIKVDGDVQLDAFRFEGPSVACGVV
jgi:hypothetical protein